jgi:hypothetical protein
MLVLKTRLIQSAEGNRGFSVAESALTLILGSIVLIASIPSLPFFRGDGDLQDAMTQLRSDLRLSQSISAVKHHQRIVVVGDPDRGSYTIIDDFDGDRVLDTEERQQTLPLPHKVHFAQVTLTPPDSVIFSPTGALAWPEYGGVIVLEDEEGRQLSLEIRASGLTEVLDSKSR